MKKILNSSILFLCLIIIVFFSSSFTLSVTARNYYVNAETGNNNFNGLTTETAKKTLDWFSWSTTFLKPGDTVFVMNGTYTGGGQFAILALRASGTIEKPIVITNYPGHKPLLKLNEHKWAGIHIAEGANNIVINGLRIQGYNQNVTLEDALVQPGSCANPSERPLNPAFNGNGISLEGRTDGKHIHHITVSNCEIFECGGGGIGSMEADYITIEKNLIYNNCWYTIFGTSGISNLNSWNYDEHKEKEYSMIIRNNILFGNQLFVPWIGPCKIYDGNGIIIDSEYNEDRPFEAYSGKTLIENNVVFDNGGRGIHVYKSANVDIINNTCYFNGKSPELDDGEITVQNATSIRIYNNIMYARTNERANLRYQSPVNINFGHNLIYNASSGKISFRNETDIVFQNPEFINPDLSMTDLRIKETSPARNAGTSVPGLFSEFDINGISRMAGGAPDIGAYEFEEEIVNTIGRLRANTGFTIFPNPAKQKIQVFSSKQIFDSNVKYSLLNLDGKTVLTGELNNTNHNFGVFSVDLPVLKDGVYFFRVWNSETESTSKILIRN